MNLTLTDTAYTHLGNLLKQHDKKYVRLQVKGGGCAGFEYEWSFENEAEKDDHVIDDRLLVHKMNELYLTGIVKYLAALLNLITHVLNHNVVVAHHLVYNHG